MSSKRAAGTPQLTEDCSLRQFLGPARSTRSLRLSCLGSGSAQAHAHAHALPQVHGKHGATKACTGTSSSITARFDQATLILEIMCNSSSNQTLEEVELVVRTSVMAKVLRLHITALRDVSLRSALLSLPDVAEVSFTGECQHILTSGWDREVFIVLLNRWPLHVFSMGVVYCLPSDDILSACLHGPWVGSLVHGSFNCDAPDMESELYSFHHLQILRFGITQSDNLSITTVSKLLHGTCMQKLHFPRNFCADKRSDLGGGSNHGKAVHASAMAAMIVVASDTGILTPHLSSGELLFLLRMSYAAQEDVADPRWRRMPDPDVDLEGARQSNMWLAPTPSVVDEVLRVVQDAQAYVATSSPHVFTNLQISASGQELSPVNQIRSSSEWYQSFVFHTGMGGNDNGVAYPEFPGFPELSGAHLPNHAVFMGWSAEGGGIGREGIQQQQQEEQEPRR